MVDTFSSNMNLVLQSTGSNNATWGTELNNLLITPLDTILGGTQAITMSSSNVTLTLSQWQNKAFKITGTLTAAVSLILPLSPNAIGGTPAVGGEFVVWNATTGNFSITVLTAATGSTGVTVPQGARASLYSDTVNVWYANDAFGIPAGTGMDWFGGSTPPSGWLLCAAQSLLRAQYPALFNAISTTYGSVDGTHFTLPDCRGRVLVGKDDMGGSAANRVTAGGSGINGTVLGATGGDQLSQSHAHTGSGNVSDPGHTHSQDPNTIKFGPPNTTVATGGGNATTGGTTGSSTTGITVPSLNINASGGGGSQNMPPTIVCNKIIFSGA